jgi:tRNA-splicing ligase RtcB
MGRQSIKTKELTKIGYHNDVSRSIAIAVVMRHFKHSTKEEILHLLSMVKERPCDYEHDPLLGPLAITFITKERVKNFESYELLETPASFKVFGGKDIEGNAKRQMELAMRLPIVLQGALMPDAHTGYGLPVGGVLAADNAVIPYAVGVDIGCRMALSVFNLSEKYLRRNAYQLKKALGEWTHFGINGELDVVQEHEVLDRSEFQNTDLLKRLHGKAVKQLGSSGGGNHFVEFGLLELSEGNFLQLPEGRYLALLSHSGSRGLGAEVAKHYMQIAMDTCKLPKSAQHLAWLSLDSAAGQEYWMSMNLAGDYAGACHDRIHYNLARAIGENPVARVGNHHNFAWEEWHNGKRVIVHRKGATPACSGEAGIIPGSMIDPGYLVVGKGNRDALNSASHGAGRCLSRGAARETFTLSALKKQLSASGVTLIGGTVEESPQAYKDIEKVMQAQQELVAVHGKFFPKIVRMIKA